MLGGPTIFTAKMLAEFYECILILLILLIHNFELRPKCVAYYLLGSPRFAGTSYVLMRHLDLRDEILKCDTFMDEKTHRHED